MRSKEIYWLVKNSNLASASFDDGFFQDFSPCLLHACAGSSRSHLLSSSFSLAVPVSSSAASVLSPRPPCQVHRAAPACPEVLVEVTIFLEAVTRIL